MKDQATSYCSFAQFAFLVENLFSQMEKNSSEDIPNFVAIIVTVVN